MIIKLEINDVEKDVKIKGIGPSQQEDYYKKVFVLEKIETDKDSSTEMKVNKTKEFLNWLFDLGLKKSDLTDEEKKIVEEDVEERKKIISAVREILLPVSIEKKN